MIPYSVHVALVLATCLLFYKLLLQNETYYRLNRVILLVCLVLAFTLPLIPVPQQFSFRTVPEVNKPAVVIPVAADKINAVNHPAKVKIPQGAQIVNHTPVNAATPDVPATQRLIKWMIWLYWCGVAALGINFLLQIIVLLYQAYKKPAILDGSYRIVELSDDKAPCSFGNNIFINPAKYDWETYNQILIHEKVHIQQRHSFDLIIAELMLVLQWFNPFAWLYRKEVENNLEFLTDHSVLRSNQIAPEDYQLSLLKVCVPNFSMRITTNYNQSLLRKRIIMMNARRSNIHATWKYFMLMPLLVALVCGLNKPVAISSNLTAQQKPAIANQEKKSNKAIAKAPVIAKSKKITSRKSVSANSAGIMPVLSQSATAIPASAKNYADSQNVKIAGNETTKHSIDELIYLQTHHVSKEYIKGFANIGYNHLTPNELYYLQSKGVGIEYVKSFVNMGYNHLTPNEMYYLQSKGVSIEYVKSFVNMGYNHLTAEEMYYLQSKGVSIEYVKSFVNMGYSHLTPGEMYYLQSKGVSIEYVKSFVNMGYSHLTPVEMYYLQSKGVRSEYVKSFINAGYKNLTVSKMYDLQSKGITPE